MTSYLEIICYPPDWSLSYHDVMSKLIGGDGGIKKAEESGRGAVGEEYHKECCARIRR